MTNIVVLIKQVPDSGSERKLSDDFSLDRSIDPVIDEINEKAVEAALTSPGPRLARAIAAPSRSSSP